MFSLELSVNILCLNCKLSGSCKLMSFTDEKVKAGPVMDLETPLEHCSLGYFGLRLL